MRTFVFITGVPEFLLQPLVKSEAEGNAAAAAGRHAPTAASKFDLRYERLRRLLVEHSSGVMLVMHLESKGYALALYASEDAALAACKAEITPEQPGRRYAPLRLRIIEREKPRPPEPVYTACLVVEGEEVRKADLADTRGLELVYRGRAIAKWCPRTLAGEDCFFGVSCLKLHRAAVQRTVRKRPRIEDDHVAAAHFTREQQDAVHRVLASVQTTRATLAPASVAMPNCVYVPVSPEEAEALCRPVDAATSRESHPAHDALLARLTSAVESYQRTTTTTTTASGMRGAMVFPRLSCAGGAPWDWSIECEDGLRQLRRCCPLPANGAPTPLERDLYTQRLWYHMNQLNQCDTAGDVLRMLAGSRRVREALRSCHGAAGDSTVAAGGLSIVLQPWLYLPTVGCEVSAYLERGGRRVRGVVQRYGQTRLMTSATLLASSSPREAVSADVDALLGRYAVLESAADEVAEGALSRELRALQRCFASAVGDVAHHLQTHSDGAGGDGAAWCVHLAAVLTPGVSPAAGPPPSVRLLSASPYQRALEECPMYTSLAPPATAADDAAAAAAPATAAARLARVDVTWNTQRHPYIPLFSRDVLERLRVDAEQTCRGA
ncbi:hypothetical protein NESM_000086500 [Novymonas esmeraldas]|uniref:Uncharacterized protein n=1 Tax=Novymonas esmeraldas TaxID=1808958 RepID=A0AAW0F3W5_9TRYP